MTDDKRHSRWARCARQAVFVAILLLCCLVTVPGCGSGTNGSAASGSDGEVAAESVSASTETNGKDDDAEASPAVDRETVYYDVEHVVLYLDAYGELPPNYLTSDEARNLGWEGGPIDPYQKDAAIGGDHFGNYEGLLPDGDYHECDIDTHGSRRGAKRLVWSTDGHYYYTEDHYASFVEVIPDGDSVTYGDTFD